MAKGCNGSVGAKGICLITTLSQETSEYLQGYSPITIITKLTRPNHFLFTRHKTCILKKKNLRDIKWLDAWPCFSAWGLTHFSMSPKLPTSWLAEPSQPRWGVPEDRFSTTTCSTLHQAAPGKVQTVSSQWPREDAAELHHLDAHWKDLGRIARTTIRIYYCIHRTRSRELVKENNLSRSLL